MKLTVIGGGSVRSMFLSKSIALKAAELGISELALMDNDSQKLAIYGGMAAAVASIIAPQLVVKLYGDAMEAITNADYIITTIRVGGDAMRVLDERIALNKGVLGQETTGAAGFSFAMRSIPQLVKYMEIAKKVAKPTVKVFNFTNPAGIVTEALRALGYNFAYGICDAPSGMLQQFAALYGRPTSEISGECYGINHLSFFKSVKLKGIDITNKIINDDRAYADTELRIFNKADLQKLHTIPNEYLYYYYYPQTALANILRAPLTRGELIADINNKMTAELSGVDVANNLPLALAIFDKWYGMREDMYMASETGVKRQKPWHFDMFSKEIGGYASVALKYIELATSGETGEMILCTRNNGAIAALKDTDVVEITCTVMDGEVIPHEMDNLSELNMELVGRVKMYERLGAQAIISRNKSLAQEALFVNPLVNSYSLAGELLDEYITHNKEYIGGWH